MAAIVGPYDRKLPSTRSSMLWFYVDHAPGAVVTHGTNPLDAGFTPMELKVGEGVCVCADGTRAQRRLAITFSSNPRHWSCPNPLPCKQVQGAPVRRLGP